MPSRKKLSQRGFSLVELLAVIAIIAIVSAAGMGMLHVRDGNPASAVDIVSSACSAAQADAIATGAPSLVLLCMDTTAGDKYLRYLAILGEDLTRSTGTTTYWQLTGKGNYLPQGTVFLNNKDYSTIADTFYYDFTNKNQDQDGTTGSLCTYVEFDPTGQLMNPNENNVQWVFAHGVITAGNTSVITPHQTDIDGFIIRRLGKLVYFRSPGQIQSPVTTMFQPSP